jgi:hypothetical protein
MKFAVELYERQEACKGTKDTFGKILQIKYTSHSCS